MADDTKDGTSRRDLLKLMSAGAPVAVASVAVGATQASAEEVAETGAGLRKTDHVKKDLDSARF